MARGARQSALTIDLQKNANAANAVTPNRGTPPAGGRRPKAFPPAGMSGSGSSPGGRPAESVPARRPLTPEAPRRPRGLGTCMVCGTHGSTQSTGERSSVQPISRVNRSLAALSSQQARGSSRLGSPTRPPGTLLPPHSYRGFARNVSVGCQLTSGVVGHEDLRAACCRVRGARCRQAPRRPARRSTASSLTR
jgi:hypothetical protein